MEPMEIPKPSEGDKEFFRSLVPDGPGVEVKPMFGNLGAFVNGNMFAGLFGRSVGLRLDEDETAELRAIPGSGPFGPAERPMGGYTSVPAVWREEPELLQGWVEKARAHVATFPPKAAKARKPKR
jgi:TfoX/Sxy family transcriptional regulator of competence genes